MSKLSILVTSSGKNLDLGNTLLEMAQKHGHDVNLIDVTSLNLPLYSPAEEKNGIPEAAKELTEKLIQTESMIFVAPEYNGGVPPVFNNAIAWISRSSENWRDAFNEKTAALATHSGGGGNHVLMAMRSQLSFMGMNVLGRQLLTSYQKPLNTESADVVLKQL